MGSIAPIMAHAVGAQQARREGTGALPWCPSPRHRRHPGCPGPVRVMPRTEWRFFRDIVRAFATGPPPRAAHKVVDLSRCTAIARRNPRAHRLEEND
jgi:hypothetical protein